ncbi:PHB depolymerase family esterase [Streptomyces sodiiphilus]|uniref:PHB depolymerase family esterase n=1 Tax=Streptomyces sodiiphilus TaxID=226217 RepID=A0ABP5A387_9ACTN
MRAASLRRRAAGLLTAFCLAAAGVLLPAAVPASAAGTLDPVPSFGSNPGNLGMYRYVPAALPAGSPVVVLLHGCGQSAPEYVEYSGWQKFADAHGFSLVAAEQRTANNSSRCFNWFETGDTSRGQGEALSIRQMVDRTVSDLGADPDRVFVTGLSAGGAMTASLLAVYPDAFAGGAVIAGLPHRCATSMIDAFTCMNPGRTRTAQAWGDLVRAGHPGHQGARPPVSVWHGGADYVVATANMTESVKQWTNAHGTDQAADATEQLPANTTRSEYHDAAGQPVVISYLLAGAGHGTPVDPGTGATQCGRTGGYFLAGLCSSYWIAADWGLTGEGPGPDPDPEPDPEPDPDPEPEPDPDPEPPLSCHTASNWAHTQAGRATHSGGRAYAVGSGDDLGLWNVFVTTSLTETSPGHYSRTAGC